MARAPWCLWSGGLLNTALAYVIVRIVRTFRCQVSAHNAQENRKIILNTVGSYEWVERQLRHPPPTGNAQPQEASSLVQPVSCVWGRLGAATLVL